MGFDKCPYEKCRMNKCENNSFNRNTEYNWRGMDGVEMGAVVACVYFASAEHDKDSLENIIELSNSGKVLQVRGNGAPLESVYEKIQKRNGVCSIKAKNSVKMAEHCGLVYNDGSRVYLHNY